jgi:hypothetical protein
MKYLSFFLICFLLIPITSFSQKVEKEEISAAINFDKLTHPYLFFDVNGLKKIKQYINTDPESKDIMARFIVESDMLIHMPVSNHIPARGKNVRAGWTETDIDNEYERKMSKYTRHAEKLAFVFQITGDKKYAQKAFEFAEVVCSMPVWILQAHEFPIIYSRVMPWNVPDNQVNFNFDIRTATIGEVMSCVYDWTYYALEGWQRDRIRGALLEKVITPVRGDYEFHWWATSYRCNWTGVCNGGLGVTALSLLKDHPSLIDVVTESYNRINNMMNEIGVDGGWQEGASYLHYGLTHSTRFAIALKKISNGQYNLFNNKRLKVNPATFLVDLFIPPNRAVNFGDSKDYTTGSTHFLNLMASETNNNSMAWYRSNVLGKGKSIFDLIFPRPTFEGSPPTEVSKHFKTIDWWVMRSDFVDENKVFLAGKSGKNNDPHHGHLDIGHFVLFWQGQAFIKDSGQPYYDEKYFDEERWKYPQATSAGHNVVSVNGEQQISGKLKNKPFNHHIGGEILEFKTSKKRDYVLMDPTDAYPKKELKKWHRHLLLEKPNITLVVDDIETHQKRSNVDVRFHSEAKEEMYEKDFVVLEGENAKMALIPLSDQSLSFYKDKHAYQPVHGKKPFEWLPYFGIRSESKDNQSRIATLILPVEDKQEAASIHKSLKMINNTATSTISFTYREASYSYEFLKENNNLKLK